MTVTPAPLVELLLNSRVTEDEEREVIALFTPLGFTGRVRRQLSLVDRLHHGKATKLCELDLAKYRIGPLHYDQAHGRWRSELDEAAS